MKNVSTPYQALFEIYQYSEVKNNVREVDEMLGFICAIAASPVPLELQDWFPYLWKQGVEPSFANEKLAIDFASATLAFYENCLLNYQQCKPLVLPDGCWLDKSQLVSGQGVAFASGYLLAFNSIEAYWQALNLPAGSEPDQLLQTSMLLLSKMATSETTDLQMQALFAQLPDLPEIVSALPRLLSTLGHFSVQVNHNE